MPSRSTGTSEGPQLPSACLRALSIIAFALPLGVTLVPLVFWVVLSLSANDCEGYLRFMERMVN